MSADRDALAVKQLTAMGKQRVGTPTAPKPPPKVAKRTPKNAVRDAALSCGHSYEVNGRDKQFPRLFCGKCGGFREVTTITRR